MDNGEPKVVRTTNLQIKSRPILCPPFSRNNSAYQQLTSSLAHTENPLQMFETLSMLSNVQHRRSHTSDKSGQ